MMLARGLTLLTMAVITIATADAPRKPGDRRYEGSWYLSDTTDNNTGAREVEASVIHIKGDDFLTLTMRCSDGRPTFFVDWDDRTFPDQAVLSIGPSMSAEAEPAEHRYVFEKATDVVQRGLRASPETSAQIVTAMGDAAYATITAYLTPGSRTVGVDIAGVQRAWGRVTRHCPIKNLPQPPL